MNTLKNELIDKIAKLNKDEVDKKIKNEVIELIHKNTDLSLSEYKVFTRIKEIRSAIEKIDRKNYKSIKEITDLVGVKIVVKDLKNLLKIRQILESKYKVLEVNDYILKPHNNGYVGLNQNFKINSYNVEFQIKTKNMDYAQQLTHDTFYKGNLPTKLKYKMNKIIFEYYTTEDVKKYKDLHKTFELKKDPEIKKVFNELESYYDKNLTIKDIKNLYKQKGNELEKNNNQKLKNEFLELDKAVKIIKDRESNNLSKQRNNTQNQTKNFEPEI